MISSILCVQDKMSLYKYKGIFRIAPYHSQHLYHQPPLIINISLSVQKTEVAYPTNKTTKTIFLLNGNFVIFYFLLSVNVSHPTPSYSFVFWDTQQKAVHTQTHTRKSPTQTFPFKIRIQKKFIHFLPFRPQTNLFLCFVHLNLLYYFCYTIILLPHQPFEPKTTILLLKNSSSLLFQLSIHMENLFFSFSFSVGCLFIILISSLNENFLISFRQNFLL